MNLLTVEKLTKAFGNRVLFDAITFGINDGDKIGVIGVNGTGKSTLLEIVAGEEQGDLGRITKMNGLKMAYLPQEPVFIPGTTVIEQIFQQDNPMMSLVRDYEKAVSALEKGDTSQNWEKIVSQLSEQMDKMKAWELESDAKTILTKLGINEFDKKVEQLSGGQRKRVALAGALLSPVDLLILDEPTNHIDNDTVEWLEKYLQKYTKALLMVTHDRYFLDRVANRTLELEKGKLYAYEGNFSQFLEAKAEREELERSGERKRQNFLRTELEWVRRGAQARSTKQKARLQRFEDVSSVKAPEKKQNVEIASGVSRLGKKTVELSSICKGYHGVTYIQDFSYIILRDDRIGIIGTNGCGKSTLVKIMTGELQPDSGFVSVGDTVKFGVFSQEIEDMEEDKKVIDYIKDIAEYVSTGDGKISASQMLERFLFPVDMQRAPISILSGGERRRLYLLKILMSAPNLLFLDEPTNDLDIETLNILENYLESFQGAVIVVSHDRYFLDKTVNRIFAFEGQGKIKQYEGGYTDYKQEVVQEEIAQPKLSEVSKKKDLTPARKTTKLSYKDQREYDSIGDVIAELENDIEKTNQVLEETKTDYVKLQELTEKRNFLEQKLEEALERWMTLSEMVEAMELNKEDKD